MDGPAATGTGNRTGAPSLWLHPRAANTANIGMTATCRMVHLCGSMRKAANLLPGGLVDLQDIRFGDGAGVETGSPLLVGFLRQQMEDSVADPALFQGFGQTGGVEHP